MTTAPIAFTARTDGGTGVRLATPADHEAIHALNYRTFVEEIPQHPPNAERRLVDRFHDENVYAVYEVGGRIIGMVCGRPVRPFSLDQKLGPIDSYLPAGCTPVEIRLLAVEPAHRATRVFARLMRFITEHFMTHGYDVGVISGTTRQLALYEQLGFTPFGPLIGTTGAQYQPMYVTAERVRTWPSAMSSAARPMPLGGNFLPGPVHIATNVRAAFARDAASHRSDAFRRRLQATQQRLCALTGARHATLLLGSGTLANDVVGAQLGQLDEPGVVFSNGEFGDRLADHAARLGLAHVVVRVPWGHALDTTAVDAAMRSSDARWLWAVHTETSTGVVNDLGALRLIATRHGAKLALDAISSVGGIPVDLAGVWCASAVSGKALAAFPGVAIVLHAEQPPPASSGVPRYLDLGLAIAHEGVPFTQSSNLLDALGTSLEETDWVARMAACARDGVWLRGALARAGFSVLAPDAVASPIVHTIVLPAGTSANAIGDAMRARGWLVSYESAYLRTRNWLQLCLMGEYEPAALRALPRVLAEVATPHVRCGVTPASVPAAPGA